MTTTSAAAWRSFVAELTNAPDVVAALRIAHTPDAHGLCLGCGSPGRGTPYRRWPCSLFLLADAARAIREAS